MVRILTLSYLVAIHFFIVVVLLKTDVIDRIKIKMGLNVVPSELTSFYHDMVEYQKRVDKNIPDNAVIFIGDSFIQSLAVSATTAYGVNFGIGGDTTVGVLNRLPYYKSIGKVRSIVLAIGANDLMRRDPDEIIINYKKILESLPDQANVVVVAIHPVDEKCRQPVGRSNSRIKSLNSKLKELCARYVHVAFFAIEDKLKDRSGNLSEELHEGDGVHLNQLGYQVWIDEFKKIIITNNKVHF
jgi:lysophospholipase L1-like esterase